jgi:hypothetical protein
LVYSLDRLVASPLHAIDTYLAEGVCKEERLKERVQVTCCALVLEANHAGFFLRIITGPVRYMIQDMITLMLT